MAKKLIVIASEWPEPDSSAAGSRMMQILNIFLSQNYSILYLATAHRSDYMFDLESIALKTKQIQLNDDSFDDFIIQENPSIVLFDRFTAEEQFGWRVTEQCPNCLKILDTEDLHFLRKARHESIKKFGNLEQVNLYSDTAKREIASILRCDLSLVISTVEINLLQTKFKINPDILFYLPFLYDQITDDDVSKLPSFEDRKDFVFIGNFFHEPNIDAVLQLKNEIWPLIKKIDNRLILNIFGAYMPQKITQLNTVKDGFLVHGRAENARTVIENAKILLAPLRFGAGIKGKLVEAQKLGTPSITTTIGAEAMSENDLWNGFVTNDPNDFASEAVKLYHQKENWLVAQNTGFQIFNAQYNRNKFQSVFVEKINFIQSTIIQHRQGNFLGSILNYHSMQSTKYMSKWIIEKNK